MNHKILALDIGGTKTEMVIFEFSDQTQTKPNNKVDNKDSMSYQLNGRTWFLNVLLKKRMPTNRNQGYSTYIKNVSEFIQNELSQAKIDITTIKAMGAGIPGSVDPSSGKMINGNSLIFKDKNILEDIKKNLGISDILIAVENDANLFAYAEVILGAGKIHAQKHKLSIDKIIGVGIILGTGVGGGAIIEGKILSGAYGGGAEIGHTNHIPEGVNCYCGAKGCVEQYLSGPAIENQYREIQGSELSSQEIFRLAQEGDQAAEKIVASYQENLIQFLSQLYNLFDPHLIVLGGGVSNQEVLYEKISEKTSKKCFLPNLPRHIYQNTLGDSAGVYGAALIAFQKVNT